METGTDPSTLVSSSLSLCGEKIDVAVASMSRAAVNKRISLMPLLNKGYKLNGCMLYDDPDEMIRREKAALVLCGMQMNRCYFISEIIDAMMVDAMGKFKKCSWYKFTIKRDIKTAHNKLLGSIKNTCLFSKIDRDFMLAKSDMIYDHVCGELKKIEYAVVLNLQRLKLDVDPGIVAPMLCVDSVLQLNNLTYDALVNGMVEVFPTDYKGLYKHLRQDDVLWWWRKGTSEFLERHLPCDLDVCRDLPDLITGLEVLHNKIDEAYKTMGKFKVEDLSVEEQDVIRRAYEALNIESLPDRPLRIKR